MSEATPGFYRLKLGAFEAIPLHDGVLTRDRPAGFVRNASDDAVGEAFAQAGMPRDKLTITFTTLALRTPSGVVLIDTGFGDSGPPGTGKTAAHLAAAGIAPEDVGTVIISHFHGDHISGLFRKDGTPIYPNAKILVPQPEWDFWMDDAKMEAAAQKDNFLAVRKVFGPIANTLGRFAWNDTVLPGITARPANGHTPGMTAFEIESEGEKLMFVADITNNPMLFVRNPTWQAVFDMDPDTAIATRRRILDRAADEKLRLFFFHAPFPGLAYVTKAGDRYEYLPALWQN